MLNQPISIPTFSVKTGTAHACIEATAGSPPNAAPPCDASGRLQRLPGCDLRTPHSRFISRHRRLSAAAAASNAAAAAAARLLLRKATGDARTGVRAAATGHPGGQTATSAAAHAATIEPGAPAALAAALTAAAATGAGSRGLHTGHTERAETMHTRPKREGRVRRVEMDSGGWPRLGWLEWLRQGPGRRRGRTQEQQQAAFAGAKSRVRKGGIPWMRPRSPVKDKPTARRLLARLGMDDPGPLGSGAALTSPEARAGPTYASMQCSRWRASSSCTPCECMACVICFATASLSASLRRARSCIGTSSGCPSGSGRSHQPGGGRWDGPEAIRPEPTSRAHFVEATRREGTLTGLNLLSARRSTEPLSSWGDPPVPWSPALSEE